MKLRICRLANVVGSAAFILVGSFTAMALAETSVERGSYLVNTIGACSNCHQLGAEFWPIGQIRIELACYGVVVRLPKNINRGL